MRPVGTRLLLLLLPVTSVAVVLVLFVAALACQAVPEAAEVVVVVADTRTGRARMIVVGTTRAMAVTAVLARWVAVADVPARRIDGAMERVVLRLDRVRLSRAVR